MNKILAHFKYFVIIVIFVLGINITFHYFNTQEVPSVDTFLNYLLWTAYFSLGMYLINTPVTIWVSRIFPNFDLKSILYRILTGVVASTIVSLIGGLILYAGMLYMTGTSWEELKNWILSKESYDSIKMMGWLAATISTVMHFFLIGKNKQQQTIREQKEKIVLVTTQHDSLKAQIGPHFLFNSLNVLNGLIEENPHRAQQFVAELSMIYRYVLEQKDKALVSLKDEIAFSRTYLHLIQMRYESGLEYEIEEVDDENWQIVPLSLQILLENCVKHNRISSQEVLKIKVYIQDGKLYVTNNLQKKFNKQDNIGKGLKGIVEGYNNITRQKVEILETDQEFKVVLPLISKQDIYMKNQEIYTENDIRQAKKRVKELKDFYWNLSSYLIVNAFLTFLDLFDGSLDWVYWPILGWGMGILFHAIEVFGKFNTSRWEDRQIQKELERRKAQRENFKNLD